MRRRIHANRELTHVSTERERESARAPGVAVEDEGGLSTERKGDMTKSAGGKGKAGGQRRDAGR
jgi:hypothetical protein